MKTPKISIIIPVYNVEKWIDRCIQSVLEQVFQDWEAIVVNDGSTDSSGQICDDYSLIDARIKVHHKSNEGLSSARNHGLTCACGEYIGFVDSDDCIDSQMYEDMISVIKELEVDVVFCGTVEHFWVSGKDTSKIFNVRPKQKISQEEALEQFLLDTGVSPSVCNKLTRKEFLGADIFPHGELCEDFPVTYNLLLNASSFAHSGKAYYHYYHDNPKSIMSNNFSQKMLPLVQYPYQVMQDVAKKFPKLKKQAEARYIRMLMNAYEDLRIGSRKNNDYVFYNKFKKQVKRDVLLAIGNKYIPKDKQRYAMLVFLNLEQFAKKITWH